MERNLEQAVIYSLFVRNHTEAGTFEAVIPDLDRIRDLGTDIIWLMPIHPIGEAKRKGGEGSPYAIRDYRAVNPEFGTLEEFKHLVEEIHARGMKCIIDVVYNHTSPDSWLVENHPEYFYRNAEGNFGNRVADWSDIIDLDYNKKELWQYQIDTLKMWAEIVDGFRCDVAPMVPIEFWEAAHAAVEAVRPGAIWLAESGHPSFITFLRSKGVQAATDYDLYRVFDLCYEYDTYPLAIKTIRKNWPVEAYADMLNLQMGTIPVKGIKMRFLENHDNSRIREFIRDDQTADNWTAMMYFQRGAALVYEGQEMSATHRPSIFDQDPIDWNNGRDISDLLKALNVIKKNERLAQQPYMAQVGREKLVAPMMEGGRDDEEQKEGNVLVLSYGEKGNRAIGYFCLRGKEEVVAVDLADGVYINQIDQTEVPVQNGKIRLAGVPVVLYE